MHRNILGAIALAVTLTACAATPEAPTAEMTRARTLIEQAEQQGAQQFAGAELERAREKFRRAEADVDEGNTEEAERMAMQSAIDAEYAAVKASSGEAQKAAEELDQSLETLRQESTRTPAPLPASPNP